MHFLWGASIFIIVSLVLIIVGAYLLKSQPWLIIWLRSNFSLALVILGFALISLIFPLSRFNNLTGSISFGTIEVSLLQDAMVQEAGLQEGTEMLDETDDQPQIHQLLLTQPTLEPQTLPVGTEYVKLSVLMVEWPKIFQKYGLAKGYANGFVYPYSDTPNAAVGQRVPIKGHEHYERAWEILNRAKMILPFLTLIEDTSEPIPLFDGAKYEIGLTVGGINFKEVKESAVPSQSDPSLDASAKDESSIEASPTEVRSRDASAGEANSLE